MKTILCDASPLIFLAKLDELELIPDVLGGEVVILQCILDEVCSDAAGDVELIRLREFLRSVTVVEFSDADYPSQSLSRNDRCILNWAIRNAPDHLVADERLLRRIAKEEGITAIGTFGILVAAPLRGIRSVKEIRSLVKDLVGVHGCRISVALYQKILDEVE